MKKFFALLTLLCGTLLSGSEYNFIALGDIHYDGAQYHKLEPQTAGRKKERQRNLSMWENGKSAAVLSAAAAQAKSSKSAFVVQLGDFTQGDCDTQELQEQMFADGFAKVKSFFPGLKLFSVKGNHDVRVTNFKRNCNTPAEKAFMPLIAKELGRENFIGSYTVKHGKDLFICFDNFYDVKTGLAFIRKALKENKDARYVFFITHIPVLPCSQTVPEWLVQGSTVIADMLAERNAIILAGHTHHPSFMSFSNKNGTVSQLVVSSMGSQWNPKGTPSIQTDSFEEFTKASLKKTKNVEKRSAFFKRFEKCTINRFNLFSIYSGFAVIKVDDNAVTAELHTGDSGIPWKTITLRKNAKPGK